MYKEREEKERRREERRALRKEGEYRQGNGDRNRHRDRKITGKAIADH